MTTTTHVPVRRGVTLPVLNLALGVAAVGLAAFAVLSDDTTAVVPLVVETPRSVVVPAKAMECGVTLRSSVNIPC